MMVKSKFKHAKGLLLVEVLLASVILTIAVLGAMGYQYHAIKHARRAQADMTATRVAQLLLEDWKSTGGAANYDPAMLGMGFSETAADEYAITIDNLPMRVTLSHNDVATDKISGVTLRRIRISVGWRNDYQAAQINNDDPSLVLTTYTRLDQADG